MVKMENNSVNHEAGDYYDLEVSLSVHWLLIHTVA